jgi:cyclic pyranopterin monophosphate synthase
MQEQRGMIDRCKAVDPSMIIHGIRVLKKEGEKSGHWEKKSDD